jgi:hypothetical protein
LKLGKELLVAMFGSLFYNLHTCRHLEFTHHWGSFNNTFDPVSGCLFGGTILDGVAGAVSRQLRDLLNSRDHLPYRDNVVSSKSFVNLAM